MLDILINLATQGASQTQTTLQNVATATNNIDGAANNAADGLNNTTTSLNNTSSAASSTTARLNDVLTTARNVGAGMAVAGAASLAFANSLIEVAEGGNAMEARLESILGAQKRIADLDKINDGINEITVKGHFDDDDGLRDAVVKMMSFSVETRHATEMLENAARQARTMGTDVSSVAEQLAKAYNTGNVAALKKSGVTMSSEDVETIKAAYAMSQELGQQKFMELVTPAIVNNTVDLANSLTDATAAANDFARGIDDLQTNVGTGAAEAKRAITEGILAPILAIVGASPEMQKTGGWLLYIGSTAMTAGGSLIALGSQVGLTMLAFPALGTSATAAFMAIKAAAASTVPFLTGIAGALAIPLGILAAGIAVGMIGYELLRKVGVLGKDAPSAIQAAQNVVNNVKGALGIGSAPAATPSAPAPALDSQAPAALPVTPAPVIPATQTASVAPSVPASTAALSSSKEEEARQQRVKKAIEAGASNDNARGWQVPDGILDGSAEDENALIEALKSAESKKKREAEKNAEKKKREDERLAKEQDRSAERVRDYNADIAIAKLQAATDIAIARLEKQKGDDEATNKGIDYKVAQLRAEQQVKEADVRASVSGGGAKDSSAEIARIRAAADLQKAALERDAPLRKTDKTTGIGGQKNEVDDDKSLAEILRELRGGASLSDITKSDSLGKAIRSTQNGSSANSTNGNGDSSTRKSPLTVEVALKFAQESQASGDILLKVFGETLIRDSFKRAMRGI